jgi:hypothetical protein
MDKREKEQEDKMKKRSMQLFLLLPSELVLYILSLTSLRVVNIVRSVVSEDSFFAVLRRMKDAKMILSAFKIPKHRIITGRGLLAKLLNFENLGNYEPSTASLLYLCSVGETLDASFYNTDKYMQTFSRAELVAPVFTVFTEYTTRRIAIDRAGDVFYGFFLFGDCDIEKVSLLYGEQVMWERSFSSPVRYLHVDETMNKMTLPMVSLWIDYLYLNIHKGQGSVSVGLMFANLNPPERTLLCTYGRPFKVNGPFTLKVKHWLVHAPGFIETE